MKQRLRTEASIKRVSICLWYALRFTHSVFGVAVFPNVAVINPPANPTKPVAYGDTYLAASAIEPAR